MVQTRGSVHDDAPLLNQSVEVFGLVAREDLNGTIGKVFQYDVSRERYLVVLKRERVFVKAENLRPREVCSNDNCNVHGLVLDKSMAHMVPMKLRSKALFVCASCSDAVYCSRRCQRESWNLHKKTCKLAKDIFAMKKLLSRDEDINRLLQSREKGHRRQNRMNKRVLISLQFSDADDLRKKIDKTEWIKHDGFPCYTTFTPPSNLQYLVHEILDPTGCWQKVLDQTENYNPLTHMSVLVLIHHSGVEAASYGKNILIPRLLCNAT